jgi:hypothetical protein
MKMFLTANKKVLSGRFVTSRNESNADRTAPGLWNLHLTTRRGQNEISEEIGVETKSLE